ncbi:MAG: type II secretion system protein [Haloferacaceae archaeon]
MSLLDSLARRYPWPVREDPDLARALAFLGRDESAATVLRAGYALGPPAFVVSLLAGWVVLSPAVAVLLAVAAGLGTGRAVHGAPVAAAALARTRALGAATGLFGRAALRMRVEPSPERAAAFAARTGGGPLARSLAVYVRRAGSTSGSGFEGFASAWREWFPELERAAALLSSAAAVPADERERVLDRALGLVRESARRRAATFASDVRGPASGLYAFGVLLPLSLVGVLPAARVAGVGISLRHFVVAYDVVLPAALVAASVRLLLRRPVAFPVPRIGSTHPAVPDGPGRAVSAAVAAGVAAALVGGRVAGWTAPLAAVGAGVGTGLVVHYRPAKAVRDRVRAVESGLPDVLSSVGRRVADGDAVERALADASETHPGATGDVVADAVRVRRRLGTSVRESFLGRYGALSDVPSPRTESAAALLSLAAVEGPPAGDALAAAGDHLREVRRVERASRRELAAVTGTLSGTAALFGPLAAGVSVALVDGMGTTASDAAALSDGLSTPGVGLAVGAYVLVLAVTLTVLSTGLERGLDPSLTGYRVGVSLLAATATYLTAVAGAGVLV